MKQQLAHLEELTADELSVTNMLVQVWSALEEQRRLDPAFISARVNYLAMALRLYDEAKRKHARLTNMSSIGPAALARRFEEIGGQLAVTTPALLTQARAELTALNQIAHRATWRLQSTISTGNLDKLKEDAEAIARSGDKLEKLVEAFSRAVPLAQQYGFFTF
jgi:hypothetical protein